ncbi:MAG: hypothetical protein JXB00_11850 [Bacteroidales bacterium]|nr:hypothetical protein [Bacteroidales bacterium]
MIRIFFLGFAFAIIISCTSEEGEGGNSVIEGKVFTKVYNNSFTHLIDSFYAPDIDVFIIYGDDQVYSNDIKTNWDGSYRFEYLRKGNYKIFAYSTDTTGLYGAGIYPVMVDVKIKSNNEVVKADDIVVLETMDYDDGTSSITGRVYVRDYNNERTTLLAEYYGADERVFVVYGNDKSHFDDVRTHHNGTYQFSNLVKGTYIVYALTDPTGRQVYPVADTVEITEDFQHVVLDDFIIIK